MHTSTEHALGDLHIHLASDLDAHNPRRLSPEDWAITIIRQGYLRNIRYFAFTPHHHGLVFSNQLLRSNLDAISDLDIRLADFGIQAILPKTETNSDQKRRLTHQEVVVLQGFEATCLHIAPHYATRKLTVTFPHVLCYLPSWATLEFLSSGKIAGQQLPILPSIRKLSQFIHSIDGICIAAHPVPDAQQYHHLWSLTQSQTIRGFLTGLLDGAESYNAKTAKKSPQSYKSNYFPRRFSIPHYKNSDAHSPKESLHNVSTQTRNTISLSVLSPDDLIVWMREQAITKRAQLLAQTEKQSNILC